MDMYQKKKMRKEKNVKEIEENNNKSNINWYPGHMAKTKKQIAEDIKLIDVVIELLDARMPISSHNPDLDEIIKNKKRIIILNKSDLADEKINKEWKEFFEKNNNKVIICNSNLGDGTDKTIKAIKDIMQEEILISAEKGRIRRNISCMVIGIPNVGKSSYINRVCKKTSAKVGNKPGVTTQKQWIKLDNQIELLDTPGVLWPKFENEITALNLSYTGTIKDEILDKTEVAYSLLKLLVNEYKNNLENRYNLENIENMETIDIMEAIGRKRGCLVSGGRVDLEKTSNIILDDFRTGKLGKITLEKP